MTGFLKFCAAFLLLTGSAWAADPTQDSPARITPTTASSACIGTPGTPLCTAETLLACLVRNDDSLCRRIGVTSVVRNTEIPGPLQTEYALDRVSVITTNDINDDTRDLEWFKPGYTLVEISRRL